MADDDGVLHPEFFQAPGDVAGEQPHRIAPGRGVARAMPAQVECDHAPAGLCEMLKLRFEKAMVAAPAMYQRDRITAVATIPAGQLRPVAIKRFQVHCTPPGALVTASAVTLPGFSRRGSCIRTFAAIMHGIAKVSS